MWEDKNCEVMFEFVIVELKVDDYCSRMLDVVVRKRIEKKYFELIGEKIFWDLEIISKIGYLCKFWNIYS